MANLVLNYSANVYQKKLNALEGYASQLNTHLSSLESLRDRLPDVWDDDQSAEYYKVISNQILKVKDAMQTVADLKVNYQGVIDDMKKSSSSVDDIISDIKTAINMVAGS